MTFQRCQAKVVTSGRRSQSFQKRPWKHLTTALLSRFAYKERSMAQQLQVNSINTFPDKVQIDTLKPPMQLVNGFMKL